MAFSSKIVLDSYKREDGTQAVLLQAIIDRKRATVPLGFYIKQDDFDKRAQAVKKKNTTANDYNAEILTALARANSLASKYRQQDMVLTPEAFRQAWRKPQEALDLIMFIRKELELNRPNIATNTYKQHYTLINNLTSFKKGTSFRDINIEFIQEFRNHLLKKGNGFSTVEKMMKMLKQYLSVAKNKGFSFKDVFIKVKGFKSNRLSLSFDEVMKLHTYYTSTDCLNNHRKLLRYFLFSCFTGLRISDIKAITWGNIHGNMLIYTPVKTKRKMEAVKVPLLDIDKRYLSERKAAKEHVFETYADAVSNRLLKDVAKDIGIDKNITYHTSRHTFASLMAEDGNVIAVQRMLGHGSIHTSMGYIHSSDKTLIDAKKKRFENTTH